MEFTELPTEKQIARFEKVKAIFGEFKELVCRTAEPCDGMVGEYNIAACIKHPAFMDGSALIAVYDGISGKLSVYDYLKVCNGGLDFGSCGKDLDVVRDHDEILNRINQALLIASALKEIPMDIKSVEARNAAR